MRWPRARNLKCEKWFTRITRDRNVGFALRPAMGNTGPRSTHACWSLALTVSEMDTHTPHHPLNCISVLCNNPISMFYRRCLVSSIYWKSENNFFNNMFKLLKGLPEFTKFRVSWLMCSKHTHASNKSWGGILSNATTVLSKLKVHIALYALRWIQEYKLADQHFRLLNARF